MPDTTKNPARLISLDAYRGFVMLAMASGGFAFSSVLRAHPEVVSSHDQTTTAIAWETAWRVLAYQFDHVAWSGCAFWDLIQPSFMFMVGVALPYSFARRVAEGEPRGRVFLHACWRSLVLVALGVFLSSNGSRQTNFVFTNVLTQIGLGYPVLFLLLGRPRRLQLAAGAAILLAYAAWFARYEIPKVDYHQLETYLTEVRHVEHDLDQFSGFAAHWNKHTNAAAAVDRRLLNAFPREGEAWNDRKYWVNEGGYQTLNFIPSIVTMLLGLMAGELLRSGLTEHQKLARLLAAGATCLALGLALDTQLWPAAVYGCDWNLCPIVKRIWTPSWTLFSGGWVLWMLAGFYWVIDIRGWQRWAFPLVVVGMNSIAMYCLSQLLKPWLRATLKTHLATVDAWANTATVAALYEGVYGPIGLALANLALLWLICLWLYRRRIFIRI